MAENEIVGGGEFLEELAGLPDDGAAPQYFRHTRRAIAVGAVALLLVFVARRHRAAARKRKKESLDNLQKFLDIVRS